MTSPVTKYRLSDQDLLRVANVPYRPVGKSANGYLLVRHDIAGGLTEEMTHKEISRYASRGQVEFLKGHFAPAGAANRARPPEEMVSGLPEKDRKDIRRRECYVLAYKRLEADRVVRRTAASISEARYSIAGLAQSIWQDGEKAGRGGSEFTGIRQPCARTLLSWVRNYERDGLAGLRSRWDRCGKQGSDFAPRELELLQEAVRGYASSQRPTMKQIHQRLRARVLEENAARREAGAPPLRVPSLSTVERAIRKLDPLLIYAGRFGEDAALRHARTVGRGTTTLRPLQAVEMDECELDLMALITLVGGEKVVTREELRAMGLTGEKKRVWVSVAIDRASRCILALRITLTPSSRSALDTLRMVMQDKRGWADKVGALAPWSMCGRPEQIITDNGSGFVSADLRAAAEDLGIPVTRALAKTPQLRGTMESVFSTVSHDLLARLTGRTFGSVVERGDHPSEDNAALTLDDLAFALVRWVVDIYHRRPHSGLGGESPLEAWERLTSEHHVLPPPGAREMRIAFGTELTRTLAKDGIRVMNVRYHDLALAQKYVRKIGAKMTVRIDPANIGAIEIQDGHVWRALPAVDERFEGVTAWDWARAVEARNRRRRETDEEVFDGVWAAYEAIRERNDAARSMRGLVEDVWDEDRLERVEERLTAYFATRERVRDPETPDPIENAIPTGGADDAPPPPARRREPRGKGGFGRVQKED